MSFFIFYFFFLLLFLVSEETPSSTQQQQQQQQPQYSNLSTDLMNLSLTPTLFSQGSAKGNQEEEEAVPEVKLPNIKFKLTPLLSHITARGLSVEYFFGRRTSLFPDKMVSVQLVVTNRGQKPIGNIKISTEVLFLSFSFSFFFFFFFFFFSFSFSFSFSPLFFSSVGMTLTHCFVFIFFRVLKNGLR